MERKIKIVAGAVEAVATLNQTATATKVWEVLPLTSTTKRWGDEIYFLIPVESAPEDAKEKVEVGEVAYWPEGRSLCIFFGPTPVSTGNEIRAAGPVNIVGKVEGNPKLFGAVTPGTEIGIHRVEKREKKIALGSDERTHLTDCVIEWLRVKEFELRLFGALAGESLAWPDVAEVVGRSVAIGECDEGLLFCWTGTGVCIAANKVPGVRAALCHDATTAEGARRWNYANVLVMSLRLTAEPMATEILEAWFSTPFGGGEDAENVAKVTEIEHKYGLNGLSSAPSG